MRADAGVDPTPTASEILLIFTRYAIQFDLMASSLR